MIINLSEFKYGIHGIFTERLESLLNQNFTSKEIKIFIKKILEAQSCFPKYTEREDRFLLDYGLNICKKDGIDYYDVIREVKRGSL
jgi:hypothetical protein